MSPEYHQCPQNTFGRIQTALNAAGPSFRYSAFPEGPMATVRLAYSHPELVPWLFGKPAGERDGMDAEKQEAMANE